MERVIEFVKKYWIILTVIMIFVIPLGINMAFKVPAISEWFSYEEKAGDLIDFYASILSTIGTVFLGYIAYKQNEVANRQTGIANEQNTVANALNERLVKLEEVEKRSYVLLDENASYFDEQSSEIVLVFRNELNEIPIIDLEFQKVDSPIKKFSVNGEEIREVNPPDEYTYEMNSKEFTINCICPLVIEDDFIFCFKVVMKNIYGYETSQLFDIWIHNGDISEVKTMAQK